jgi:hypothetical protein
MIRMRRASLVAAFGLALATGASAGVARPSDSRLIQASPNSQRLGDYRVTANPTYQGAIDGLGEATSCRTLGRSSAARAVWRELGVSMKLVTYGYIPPPENGCTAPDQIQVSNIRVTSNEWVTSRQLRVGSSSSLLRKRYPTAKRTRGLRGWYSAGYWLVTRRQVCLGSCGGQKYVTAPVLVAETGAGRVRAFVFVVGAQGE